MKTRHPFHLKSDESLIEVSGLLDREHCVLALDTAASHTVVDLTRLMLAGYAMEDVLTSVQLETAKGPIEALVFRAKSLRFLGHELRDMEICSYDFLANNILTDIDGVLGIDFFKGKDLCISFKKFEITLS